MITIHDHADSPQLSSDAGVVKISSDKVIFLIKTNENHAISKQKYTKLMFLNKIGMCHCQ